VFIKLLCSVFWVLCSLFGSKSMSVDGVNVSRPTTHFVKQCIRYGTMREFCSERTNKKYEKYTYQNLKKTFGHNQW